MRQTSTRRWAALAVLAALLLAPRATLAWGDKGHRIVGELAEEALSEEARAAVRQIAGARTLAMLSTWPDFARSDPDWGFVSTWHYVSADEMAPLDEVLAAAARSIEPDNVVEAIGYFQAILAGDEERRRNFEGLMSANGAEPREGSVELTALCFLAHFIGDLHQPMHAGRGDDRGGNSISVNFFGEVENLHSVWDSKLIEHQGLSFTEFARFLHAELDGKVDPGDGGPAAWAHESRDYLHRIYRIWSRTSRDNHLPELGYRYNYDHIDMLERRLYLAGLRLAAVLNAIYD